MSLQKEQEQQSKNLSLNFRYFYLTFSSFSFFFNKDKIYLEILYLQSYLIEIHCSHCYLLCWPFKERVTPEYNIGLFGSGKEQFLRTEPRTSVQKHIYWLYIRVVFGMQQVPHVQSAFDLFCYVNRIITPHTFRPCFVLIAKPNNTRPQVCLESLVSKDMQCTSLKIDLGKINNSINHRKQSLFFT